MYTTYFALLLRSIGSPGAYNVYSNFVEVYMGHSKEKKCEFILSLTIVNVDPSSNLTILLLQLSPCQQRTHASKQPITSRHNTNNINTARHPLNFPPYRHNSFFEIQVPHCVSGDSETHCISEWSEHPASKYWLL